MTTTKPKLLDFDEEDRKIVISALSLFSGFMEAMMPQQATRAAELMLELEGHEELSV